LDAGFAAGIQALIIYKPEFALKEAGIWAEVWAKLFIEYYLFKKHGTINLVDIYAAGSLKVVFIPKPSMLNGEVSGYLKLLGLIKIEFDASIETQLGKGE